MTTALPAQPDFAPGSVTLVGAGPGDPELLTLKAVRALSAATVVLLDDLVGPEVLAHVAPSARVVRVGKRGGCRSTPQAFIHRLMVAAARRGEVVVRLKGGDPFIFGRGGEEVEALREAGVPVQVVNGITAGLAGLTGLGAPLTHRAHAQGVMLVTGHAQPGQDGPDWTQLSRTAHDCRLTLVIYMGVAHAAQIQQGLMAGLPASTPLAIIQNASLPIQQAVVGTLGDLVRLIADHRLASPAIMVVGDVVRVTSAHGLLETPMALPPQGAQAA